MLLSVLLFYHIFIGISSSPFFLFYREQLVVSLTMQNLLCVACLLSVVSQCSSFGLASKSIRHSFRVHSSISPILPIPSSCISPVLPQNVVKDNKAMNIATIATTVAASLLLFTQPASALEAVADVINTAATTDQGFLQAFFLIFVSELGDKTFFIAGLLAAKYGRFISFTGSLGALSVMTVISTVLGQLFHAVPSSLTQGIPFDDYIAVAAFTYFGIKTLYDASQLEGDDNAGILEVIYMYLNMHLHIYRCLHECICIDMYMYVVETLYI
jgi:hypothetical protein